MSYFALILNIPPWKLLDDPNTFGDSSTSAVQIKMWHKPFKDGQESIESDPCSARPATSRAPENVERVRAAINKDQ